MKTKVLFLLVVLFSLFAEVKAQSSPPPSLYEDGILHVKIKDDCQLEFPLTNSLGNLNPSNTSQLIIEGINFNSFDISKIEKTFKILGQTSTQLSRIYDFHFPNNSQNQALIDSLLKIPCVEYAERVPKMSLFTTPDDLGGSTPGTAPNQWYLHKIKAQAAWDVHNGTKPLKRQIKIAIVDDAIWLAHPDLSDVIYTNIGELPLPDGIDNDNNGYIDDIQGWDAAENDNNPNPPAPLPPGLNFPNFSHGTHVAALAGASTNNYGIGIASIGFGVKLIPVKIGLDANAVLSNVFKGVEYAAAAGADVINMSWGSTVNDITLEKMMNDIRARGIILVAAAGNDPATTLEYPASYPAVISVGATDINDQKPFDCNYNTSVDVMAPGVGIYSAIYQPSSTALYGNFNGTSMASPIVAGLCGLMLSYNPNLTPDALESCLKSNCDNIDAQNSSYLGKIGAGRINAEKTMKCLQTAPVAEFTSNFQTICVGQQIRFVCKFFSGEENATYSWSFSGANTLISTDANPAITYSTPGVYTVSVFITNTFGSTTLTKTNYITVKSGSSNYNYGVKVDNNWFMHKGLALKFPQSSVANPQFIVEGSQFPHGGGGGEGEGCASISNYDGQPLFYSNGLSVFNRHHLVMSNGKGLSPGHYPANISTISQNTIIVPDPNNCSSLYYVFHLNPNGLLYSVIDMDRDNGLGDVIPTLKNKQAGSPFATSEHLTAIMHCNGKDVWVIAHDVTTNQFRAHLVTAAGVSSSAVISNVGSANNSKQGGQMKGSPGGNKIALTLRDKSEIFDFNKGTGEVSNPIRFSNSDNFFSGIEFSADGSKVYLVGNKLVQYDLNGFSATTPPKAIALFTTTGMSYTGTLELGPDGKIYASKTGSTTNRYTKLDVINTPNVDGASCNLIPDGMPLANPNGINHFQWGMNNSFISKTLNYHGQINQINKNVVMCNGGTVTLDAGPGAAYEWENGPNFRTNVVSTAGDYPVTIIGYNGCKTKVVFVVRNETAVVDLGPDLVFNCGQVFSTILNAGIGFVSYKWSTGETTSSIIAKAFGHYYVEVTTPGGCKFMDDIYILPLGGSPEQFVTRIDYTCGSPGIDLDALNINNCPLIRHGIKTPWMSSIGNVPAPKIVNPTGNMSFRREFMDANRCVYCIEMIEITFKQASIVNTVMQLACEGNEVGITPPTDPPCNTATLWEYFYPDGTSNSTAYPFSFSAPAKNGDVYKIRSHLPNGCYCEHITNVRVLGPVIKQKTITINCGASVNLEDYAIDECPNNTNYSWGETLDSRLSSFVVSPKQTKTYYRQSYDMFGCLDCILELTVEVIRLPIANHITVEVLCGTPVDLESLSGCNGMPGTFYWHDGLQVLDPPTSVFTFTENTTMYRENLSECPCLSSVTVKVIPPTVKKRIPETHCIGKVFNFKSLCPQASLYQLIDPSGEVIGTSSSPNFSKELMKNGTYKVLAFYPNGCTCITEYLSNLPEPPVYDWFKTLIYLCRTFDSFKPASACPEAASYKWFSHDYYSSVSSQDGSLTRAQHGQLIPNPYNPNYDNTKLIRASYDANGCIICIEIFGVATEGNNPVTNIYDKMTFCPGHCVTFNIFDRFFPNLQRCQFTETSSPNSGVVITTNANGSITICVNANTTIPNVGYNTALACTNNGCPITHNIHILPAAGCKKGADVSKAEETVISDYSINIFPNPTTGMVTLDMKGSGGIVKNIQVFDVLGRRVLTASVTEEQKEFNLSEFTKGIYTIRVETDEKVHTQKVVLK